MKLNLFNFTLLVNIFSKLPIKLLILPLKTNNVQALRVLQSEKVLEMHFPVNWGTKIRDSELNKQ